MFISASFPFLRGISALSIGFDWVRFVSVGLSQIIRKPFCGSKLGVIWPRGNWVRFAQNGPICRGFSTTVENARLLTLAALNWVVCRASGIGCLLAFHAYSTILLILVTYISYALGAGCQVDSREMGDFSGAGWDLRFAIYDLLFGLCDLPFGVNYRVSTCVVRRWDLPLWG